MEPVYPEYELEYEDEDEYKDLYVQAVTRLTCAAMQAQLFKGGASAEESADQVMTFFEIAYRRIQEITEEDYLDEAEENGDHEPG